MEQLLDMDRFVRAMVGKVYRNIPRDVSVEYDDLLGMAQQIALEKNEEYDPTRGIKLSTYLYWQVRGRLLNYLRREICRQRREAPLEAASPEGKVIREERAFRLSLDGRPWRVQNPEELTAKRQVMEHLTECIATALSEDERLIFQLRWAAENNKVTLAEVAAKLGYSLNRVHRLDADAMLKLRRCLRRKGWTKGTIAGL